MEDRASPAPRKHVVQLGDGRIIESYLYRRSNRPPDEFWIPVEFPVTEAPGRKKSKKPRTWTAMVYIRRVHDIPGVEFLEIPELNQNRTDWGAPDTYYRR